MVLQEVNLALDFAIEAVAIYGGFLSYEAVRIIYGNDELKTQKRIWLPVLLGCWFFGALGVILLLGSIMSVLVSSFDFPTTLVVNAFLLLGLVFLTTATSRYLNLWSKYRNVKKAVVGH